MHQIFSIGNEGGFEKSKVALQDDRCNVIPRIDMLYVRKARKLAIHPRVIKLFFFDHSHFYFKDYPETHFKSPPQISESL